MIDYNKMTVAQIKQLLLSDELMTEEEIEKSDLKGKVAWVNHHQSLVGPDIIERPRYTDPEWHSWVMSHFRPEELIDGKYPKVDGLRRVTELLLGDIIMSGPSDLRTTMDMTSGKAVVTYKVVIEWKLDAAYNPHLEWSDKDIYPIKTFKAIASSWIGNTDDAYAVFPESIAETRAEGRALRRALRLGVVCADELTNKDTAAFIQQQKAGTTTTGEWDEQALISDQQVNSISLLCDRLGIDVEKFINSGSKTYSDITKVSRQSAAGMLKRLNQYQSSGENSIEIPLELLKEN